MNKPVYSQGVCADGAAILKDGQMITVDEIVAELNRCAMFDKTELSIKSYDAGYEKGQAEAVADYEKRLRDEFATAALTAIISLEGISITTSSRITDADYAYGYADAMMEARIK